MKQVVFNVGGALSTYVEFDGNTLMIDIGKSDSFNPIIDFLLPLYKKSSRRKCSSDNTKYYIDQLIISHPHNDHISAVGDFYKYFYSELLTCPNDNAGMKEIEKINWELFEENSNVDILKKMLIDRQPPLRPTNPLNQFIYYLAPKKVKNEERLTTKGETYCNNISIVTYLKINGTKILLPGDIMKNGMEAIIKENSSLRNKLQEGVDILIAPHHGLRSSFSTYMFNYIRNNKIRCLNIVSEKPTTPDSNRQVDSRYSSNNYCEGNNNLSSAHLPVYQRKTSNGHIFIDYSIEGKPFFEIIDDNDTLIRKFL
jgi:hypothetical protein